MKKMHSRNAADNQKCQICSGSLLINSMFFFTNNEDTDKKTGNTALRPGMQCFLKPR